MPGGDLRFNAALQFKTLTRLYPTAAKNQYCWQILIYLYIKYLRVVVG